MDTRRVAIVSSAQTELREAWTELQHVDLISRAVADALGGTGLTIRDVDFVVDSGSDVLDGRSISNCGFLGAMGAHHKEEARVEEDGLWAAAYGVAKIAGGSGRVGLIVAYSKPSESDVSAFWSTQADPFYQRPLGLDQIAASGLQAQQYLAAVGLGEDALHTVAARSWSNARRNSHVAMDAAPTVDEIADSDVVASPLRARHMARPVDGAVAVVLADAEIAHRVTSTPVWITGVGQAMDQHHFAQRKPGSLEACEAAATRAFRQAGIGDAKLATIVEVSAPSAAGELMVLESLGLAGRGSAIALYQDGASGPAINPSGGALPADPIMATGLVRLSEASRELRGLARNGGADTPTAIVHGTGGIGMQNHCVVTLTA